MNNTTRKKIDALQDRLTAFKKEVESLIDYLSSHRSTLEDITNEITEIKDEEQEKFDNMPEGLQNGDKGQTMLDAINELEESLALLENVSSMLELEVQTSDIDDAFSSLDNARA